MYSGNIGSVEGFVLQSLLLFKDSEYISSFSCFKTSLQCLFTAANDVTKQKDMSGFYRHILSQTTSGSDQPKQENVSDNETDIKIKVEKVEKR